MIQNKRFLVPIAVICLGFSVFFERVGVDVIPRVEFVQGLFLGISLGLSVLAVILEAMFGRNG